MNNSESEIGYLIDYCLSEYDKQTVLLKKLSTCLKSLNNTLETIKIDNVELEKTKEPVFSWATGLKYQENYIK